MLCALRKIQIITAKSVLLMHLSLIGAIGLASPLRRLSAKADRHTRVCRRLLVKPTSRRFKTLSSRINTKVSVIRHSFKQMFTYVSQSATGSFSVMNGHLYDIKNIPRPDYFLTFSQINVILNISKSQNTKKIKAKNTYLLEICF